MNPDTPKLFNTLADMHKTHREGMVWAVKNMLYDGWMYSVGQFSITVWIENWPSVNWEFSFDRTGSIDLCDMILTIN